MKKITITCLLVSMMFIPLCAMADVTQNDRLMQRPEWDGAVMQSNFIDMTFRFEEWETELDDADDDLEASVWSLGPTFITSLPGNRKLEFGARLAYMNEEFDDVDGNDIDSASGLSDIDAWTKYQVFKDSMIMVSTGLLLTLPTGSEDILHPRSTGEVNFELFAAGRYAISNVVVGIAHIALRKNHDTEWEAEVDGRDRDADIDGETQFGLGGGVIFQVAPELNLQAELNYANEAYEDSEDDISLSFGGDYKITPTASLRSNFLIGLDDGSPQWQLGLGGAFLF